MRNTNTNTNDSNERKRRRTETILADTGRRRLLPSAGSLSLGYTCGACGRKVSRKTPPSVFAAESVVFLEHSSDVK